MSWLEQYDTLTLVHVPQREKVYQEERERERVLYLYTATSKQVLRRIYQEDNDCFYHHVISFKYTTQKAWCVEY